MCSLSYLHLVEIVDIGLPGLRADHVHAVAVGDPLLRSVRLVSSMRGGGVKERERERERKTESLSGRIVVDSCQEKRQHLNTCTTP